MADDATTTGTPTQEGGDAPEPETTGTPETEGRDAEAAEPDDLTKLNLEWKAKAERVNALEAENAALKERLQPTPAADDVADDETEALMDLREAMDEMSPGDRKLIADNIALSQKGDAAAQLSLRNTIRQHRRDKLEGYAQQLRDIPDVEKRKKVLELFRANPKRYGDPNAAREALEAQEASGVNTKLAEENARLKEALKNANIKPPDGVATHVRGSPETNKRTVQTISRAQFLREQEAETDPNKRMARATALREGSIRYKD